MPDSPMILSTSPEAASQRTLTGWVSRNGFYYGDGPQAERTARYDGCTHVPCSKCGTPTEKMWTACDACREASARERFEAMPRAAWDGAAMIYSQSLDEYFHDLSDVDDALNEGQTLVDLRLVICEPNRASPIDPNEHFCDDLAEDGEVSSELEEAFAVLNAVIARQAPLSWSPGKFALLLDESSEDDHG